MRRLFLSKAEGSHTEVCFDSSPASRHYVYPKTADVIVLRDAGSRTVCHVPVWVGSCILTAVYHAILRANGEPLPRGSYLFDMTT